MPTSQGFISCSLEYLPTPSDRAPASDDLPELPVLLQVTVGVLSMLLS